MVNWITIYHFAFSGFHSYNQNNSDVRPAASIGIFPEYHAKAHTMSMQLHGMKQMMKATEYANPGQTPVLVSDSPIYQALKKLQWLYPDEVGEK